MLPLQQRQQHFLGGDQVYKGLRLNLGKSIIIWLFFVTFKHFQWEQQFLGQLNHYLRLTSIAKLNLSKSLMGTIENVSHLGSISSTFWRNAQKCTWTCRLVTSVTILRHSVKPTPTLILMQGVSDTRPATSFMNGKMQISI